MNPTLAAMPPQKRISECLQALYMMRENAKMMAGVSPPGSTWDPAARVAPALIATIEEDPSCASVAYSVDLSSSRAIRNKISKPLMHWACSLGCPVSVLQAIHQAFPDAVRTTRTYHMSDYGGVLPLHEAVMSDATPQTIEYLVQKYPEAVKIELSLGLPLRDAFFRSSYRQELYPLLSEGLTRSQVEQATSKGMASWNHDRGDPFPLDIIQGVIDIHGPTSLAVKGTIGSGPGVSIKVESDTLTIEMEVDYGFDFGIEQLLTLAIPLKSIETQTLDDPGAIQGIIATISPREQQEGEISDMRSITEQLGFPPHPDMPQLSMGPQLPLDLSCVENISIDSVIPSPSIMVDLLTSLRHLPNLTAFALSGAQNCCEGYEDNLFTAECFQGLAALSGRLERIDLVYFDPKVVSSLAELLRSSNSLKKVSLTSYDVLSADQISMIADALRINTSIESLKLGILEGGTANLLDVIRDIRLCPRLKEFEAEGENQEGHINDMKHFVLMRCLTPPLRGPDVSKHDAFKIYEQYFGDTPVLYSLLRYRPELWCQARSWK